MLRLVELVLHRKEVSLELVKAQKAVGPAAIDRMWVAIDGTICKFSGEKGGGILSQLPVVIGPRKKIWRHLACIQSEF